VAHRDIVVVGTSAGGVEALREMARGLPADLPAAVLIVIHTPRRSPGLVPQILNRVGALPAAHGQDREAVRPGHIYVAPAGSHMIQSSGLEDALWAAVRGFEENAKLASRISQRMAGVAEEEGKRRFEQRAQTARQHADEIRGLLDRMDAVTDYSA
jgi:chemotaxis response regulator CheB